MSDIGQGIAMIIERAGEQIKLIALVNDVSLRNLIPAELAKQFCFYQSKPQTAFSPVAVTPDELGDARDGSCCIAEVRCLETIANGKPKTPFMSFGDRIEIDMLDADGSSIFGRIYQRVTQDNRP